MYRFEELNVYQESLVFADNVYRLSEKFPVHEKFSLSNQFRRASTSIILNIAEGSSRTQKDFIHFLSLSRGSCYECVAILAFALKRSYITESEYRDYYAACEKISKMISKLKTVLQTK